MAYIAAVSLSNTLQQLQLCNDPFSNSPNYPKSQIETLCKGLDSLKKFLVENRDVKSEFESAIRDAIYEAQDVIDSQISFHYLSQDGINQSFLEDLDTVIQNITALAEKATSDKFSHQMLNRKISNSVWKLPDDINCTKKPPIVGRDEDFIQLADRLFNGSEALQVIPLVGIPGMGKTTLAKWLLGCKGIKEHFDYVDGFIISTKSTKRKMLLSLLGYSKNWGDEMLQKTDDELAKLVYTYLKHKRYFFCLDNIREVAVWNDLKELFPDCHNGSRILLITRYEGLALVVGHPHPLGRLSDWDTLDLLEKIVFKSEASPNRQFLVIAEYIAKSCRGLPLAVVIVGRLLLCAELNAEYWEIVLSSISACVNYADLVEALVALTYKHLPQHYKACLLYMATFPYNEDISILDLIRLCVTEGFTETSSKYTVSKEPGREIITDCVLQLFRRGLVFIHSEIVYSMIVKIEEEVFHDFFVRKAEEEKFFLVIDNGNITYNRHRRLCIHKNIVPFVIKDLPEYSKLKTSVSTVRSLLYIGPKHQYPLPLWLEDFKLLRVLRTSEIRFYTFPSKILQLIHLTYLSVNYDGQLPAAVCNLCNLQLLVVTRYHHVKKSKSPLYLPAEIWNMKELRYVCVSGSDLPDIPTNTDPFLENLLILQNVGAHTCTPQILKRLIELRHLKVKIESLDEDESLSFFSHLHNLRQLLAFECYVIYPDVGSFQVVPSSIPSFPSNLKHLNLYGCGFPWEYMRVIGALPNLDILKLQSCAFQGPEWEVKTNEFPNLSLLLLEDMDLENWTFVSGSSSFSMLTNLIIRHCYKLRQIPLGFGDISVSHLQMIEVVDCSMSLFKSAMQIKEMHSGHTDIKVDIYCTWDKD